MNRPKPTGADPTKTHLAKALKHERPLVCCRFSPAGPFAFAGSEDESVVRWNLADDSKIQLKAHESWVFALALTPDGATLLSAGGDGKLVWWPAVDADPKPIRTVNAHSGWINALAISGDGSFVASAGNDCLIRIWNMADGALLCELPGHEKPIYALRFLQSGVLLSADLLGRVVQWDLPPRKEARRFDAAKLHKYETGQGVDYGGVRDFDQSPDGHYIVCAGLVEASNPLGAVSNPAALVFDWNENKELKLQRTKEDVKGVGWGLRCHPDGFHVMVSGGTGGGWLWFFRPEEANEFHKLNLGNTGRALDLHPDGLRLATAHHDGHLRIWSMTEQPPKA
jgi:WD40 repeat protein